MNIRAYIFPKGYLRAQTKKATIPLMGTGSKNGAFKTHNSARCQKRTRVHTINSHQSVNIGTAALIIHLETILLSCVQTTAFHVTPLHWSVQMHREVKEVKAFQLDFFSHILCVKLTTC